MEVGLGGGMLICKLHGTISHLWLFNIDHLVQTGVIGSNVLA